MVEEAKNTNLKTELKDGELNLANQDQLEIYLYFDQQEEDGDIVKTQIYRIEQGDSEDFDLLGSCQESDQISDTDDDEDLSSDHRARRLMDDRQTSLSAAQ